VRRPENLLSLALIVSALLFLTACPFKAGGLANSGPSAQGPDGEPIVHHFGGGWIHHQKPIRISLPKPPHASRSDRLLSEFFEDHHPAAASHRAASW
jgi:hypothetical protein